MLHVWMDKGQEKKTANTDVSGVQRQVWPCQDGKLVQSSWLSSIRYHILPFAAAANAHVTMFTHQLKNGGLLSKGWRYNKKLSLSKNGWYGANGSMSPSLSLSLVFRSTQLFGLLSRTQPSRCPEAPLDFILACITGHAQDIVEVMLFPTFASGSGSHEIYSFANQCTVRDWRQVIKVGLSKMMHDLQTDLSSGSTNTNLRKQNKTI